VYFGPVFRSFAVTRFCHVASLVATCKMSDVNPVDYLAATLRAILDGHPQSGIEDLMPWRFNQPSSLAA
jgi:hypothetical protein